MLIQDNVHWNNYCKYKQSISNLLKEMDCLIQYNENPDNINLIAHQILQLTYSCGLFQLSFVLEEFIDTSNRYDDILYLYHANLAQNFNCIQLNIEEHQSCLKNNQLKFHLETEISNLKLQLSLIKNKIQSEFSNNYYLYQNQLTEQPIQNNKKTIIKYNYIQRFHLKMLWYDFLINEHKSIFNISIDFNSLSDHIGLNTVSQKLQSILDNTIIKRLTSICFQNLDYYHCIRLNFHKKTSFKSLNQLKLLFQLKLKSFFPSVIIENSSLLIYFPLENSFNKIFVIENQNGLYFGFPAYLIKQINPNIKHQDINTVFHSDFNNLNDKYQLELEWMEQKLSLLAHKIIGYLDFIPLPNGLFNIRSDFIATGKHINGKDILLIQPFFNLKKNESTKTNSNLLGNHNDNYAIIVDDSELTCQIIQEQLLKKNISSRYFLNGLDCLIHLNNNLNNLPKFIITDYEMPLMNGYELCQKIKNNAKIANIPIVMVTSKNTTKYQKFKEDGYVVDILGKPCDFHLLNSILNLF